MRSLSLQYLLLGILALLAVPFMHYFVIGAALAFTACLSFAGFIACELLGIE